MRILGETAQKYLEHVKIFETCKNICRHFLRELPAGRGGGVADPRDLRQRRHREQPLPLHGVRPQSCLCKSTNKSGFKSGLSLCLSLCMAADIMEWRRVVYLVCGSHIRLSVATMHPYTWYLREF